MNSLRCFLALRLCRSPPRHLNNFYMCCLPRHRKNCYPCCLRRPGRCRRGKPARQYDDDHRLHLRRDGNATGTVDTRAVFRASSSATAATQPANATMNASAVSRPMSVRSQLLPGTLATRTLATRAVTVATRVRAVFVGPTSHDWCARRSRTHTS